MARPSSFATALLLAASATAQVPPATFQHTVRFGGISYTADFALHSARGPSFSVVVQQADGSFATHTPGPLRTYLGTIAARPGAMAAAVRRADGSIAYHVLFEDGTEWIHNGGVTTLRGDPNWAPRYPTFVTGSGGAGSDVWAAEVGVDLPYSQYSVDNDVGAALEMVEHSVHTVNLLYLRDASVLHRLGRVVVRAFPGPDPYAGMTTTGALYNEIGNQWNNVLAPGSHDVGLVATSATGGGVAAVGVVGSPGYSANGATREGDFTVVWRHEVGHNWSLSHYDGGTPEGKTINSGNAMARMSGPEQAKLLAHRTARAASLDNLGPHPAPIPPRASLDRAAFLPQSAPLLIDVLGNDHDANGEPIRIASFDPTSRLGGAVALSPGSGPGGRDQLVYTPPAVLSAQADRFRYRIADTAGREGLGNVITRVTSDSDLLAQLSLDDGSGAVARDSSAYARHAALENGPAWSTGAVGGALTFDGVDDRVVAPAPDHPTAHFTLTAWVKRNGTQSAWAGLVFCRGGSTTAGLGFGNRNELRYHWDGGQWSWSSGLVVPDNRWTFVALVVTPTAATIAMDTATGLRFATHAVPHAVEAFDDVLTLGQDPASSGRSFRGGLDDVRVWGRALNAVELYAAAAGLAPAANPSPRHLTARNASSLTLAWTSSPAATNHRVFFSPLYAAVRDGLAAADQGLHPASSWTTPLLGNGSWFWRVDTTDGTGWARGPVWSFAVVPGPTAAAAQTYGSGCRGSQPLVPAIGAVGLPRIGSTGFAVEVRDAAPIASASLLVATAAGSLPLSGCRLLLGLPVTPTAVVRTDATGRGAVPVLIANDPALLGGRVFAQWVVLDAGGALFGAAAMSDGLHLTIGV